MKTPVRNPIKDDLKKIRGRLGITQEEAAYILGTTTTTLSRWANNRTTEPDPAHQEKLQNILAILDEAGEAIRPDGITWRFKTPHAFLSDLRPLDLLRSSSGAIKVRELLGAMRWGLPA